MGFKISAIKSILQNADRPATVAEQEKFNKLYVEIIQSAVENINGYSKEEKLQAAKRMLETFKSCKTYLQNLQMFISTIEKLNRFESNIDYAAKFEPSICKVFNNTLEHLKKIYAYEQGMLIQPGQQSIEDNHNLAMSSLISIAKLLNDNKIDYHIVGAMPCYLKAYGELLRYHSDIDIIVDDKDIPKIVELAKKSPKLKDYVISDNRNHSSNILEGFDESGKPICEDENPHQLLFQHKDSDFHIGFFQYDIKEDGKRYMKNYYTDKKTNKPVVYYSYSLNEQDWDNEYGETVTVKDEKKQEIEIPCSTVKSVYDKKNSPRLKDQFDRDLLKEYVNTHENNQQQDDGLTIQ